MNACSSYNNNLYQIRQTTTTTYRTSKSDLNCFLFVSLKKVNAVYKIQFLNYNYHNSSKCFI